MFAHGLNVHFNLIEPRADIDVLMVAPKGPAIRCAPTYQRGGGVPCLIAIHKDVSGNAHDLGLSYAAAIGGGRAGVIETSFREESRDRSLRRAGRALRRPASSWSRTPSRSWSRRDTRPRWRISSACTR